MCGQAYSHVTLGATEQQGTANAGFRHWRDSRFAGRTENKPL